MPKHTWVVSLNNGERLSSKDLLTGDRINPFTKVLDYIKRNPTNPDGARKEITHIELIVNNQRYNSPSFSKRSSFCSSENLTMFYVMYKNSALIVGEEKSDKNIDHVSYSYRLGDYRHWFWVNERDNSCHSQVLDVVNPETPLGKKMAMTERDIEKTYEMVYGG